MPYCRRPHGSFETGTCLRNCRAIGLNADGLIVLFVKPAAGASVICRPLHAGAAIAVKSPASIAAVGTKLTVSGGLLFSILPW